MKTYSKINALCDVEVYEIDGLFFIQTPDIIVPWVCATDDELIEKLVELQLSGYRVPDYVMEIF